MRNLLVGSAVLVVVCGTTAMAQDLSGPVEVPLRVQGGRLLVPVMTGSGTTLEFALTTGSGETVLSESGAKKAGTPMQLTLGGLPVPTDGAVTIPDARLRNEGKVLDGMISANMLNQFNILIDVPRGKLVLKPTGRAVSWDGVELSEPVRLRIFHGIAISLDVTLSDHPYPATLDLGTPTLIVNSRVKSELGLDDEGSASLRLGSTTLAGLPVRVEDLEIFHRWSPNGDGFVLVGAPIAFNCAVSLSWVHRELRTCVR